nr:probable purine permease 11 isoform X1 [Ipomoea batatas]
MIIEKLTTDSVVNVSRPDILLASSGSVERSNGDLQLLGMISPHCAPQVSTVLGLLLAATDVFYSLTLDYLPASTYSLLNSSQLAFTSLFSFLLNAQSFTPYIINAVILLTFSPMLLIFSQETTSSEAYFVGSFTLTFKVSSLFSNVVIRLATPLTPLLSMLLLHEEMSGLKVMSLLLSVWGFASYIYQQYLDDLEAASKCTEKISDI